MIFRYKISFKILDGQCIFASYIDLPLMYGITIIIKIINSLIQSVKWTLHYLMCTAVIVFKMQTAINNIIQRYKLFKKTIIILYYNLILNI